MSPDNEAIVRRFLEDGWGKGDEATFDQTVAADATDHNPAPGQPEGVVGFKQAMQYPRSAFPDMTTTIDDIFSAGDRVAARWTSRGTHRGDFMGAAATGNAVTMSGIDIHRVENGRIAELWHQVDTLGMLQQVGAIPSQ